MMYAERKPSGTEGDIWFSPRITSKPSATADSKRDSAGLRV